MLLFFRVNEREREKDTLVDAGSMLLLVREEISVNYANIEFRSPSLGLYCVNFEKFLNCHQMIT